jgi:hypothetical protein
MTARSPPRRWQPLDLGPSQPSPLSWNLHATTTECDILRNQHCGAATWQSLRLSTPFKLPGPNHKKDLHLLTTSKDGCHCVNFCYDCIIIIISCCYDAVDLFQNYLCCFFASPAKMFATGMFQFFLLVSFCFICNRQFIVIMTSYQQFNNQWSKPNNA